MNFCIRKIQKLNNENFAMQQPHTLPIRSSQPHEPKLVNTCVWANAVRRTKKYDYPTVAIRNTGKSTNMKVIKLK